MHALFSWQQKHALLYKILIWTFPYDFLYSWDWIMTQPHRLILNSDGVALIDCHKHHDIVNREIFALVLFRPRWEQFNLRLNGLSFLILVLSLSLLNATVSWRTQESVKLHVCKCRRIKKDLDENNLALSRIYKEDIVWTTFVQLKKVIWSNCAFIY